MEIKSVEGQQCKTCKEIMNLINIFCRHITIINELNLRHKNDDIKFIYVFSWAPYEKISPVLPMLMLTFITLTEVNE